MSHKLICLLAICTLCALVITTEARGGRGRSGSLGSAFYRRSHKKQTSSGGGSSRRKIISASPVHTDYTNSMLAAQATDEKFARHRSRHRHNNHKSTGSPSNSNNHKNQKHDSAHENHNSHTPLGKQTQHNTHSLYPLGSSAMHHGTHAVNPYVTHNWGGHQLPPGHVYVTQPSSIPTNAVYYAQAPTHTNNDDFALGYLVGRSLTRTRHHHHHHYEQQPQAQANNETQPKIVIVETQANPTVVAPTTNQTNYWPTDSEVALAPLNSTLIPNGVSQSTEPIFKSPPIISAQKLTAENATFELPSATAAPPETPPTNGIICMPWNFNETDPSNPENVIVVQKTICFPAPPAPPAPPTTPVAPIAGDIDVDPPATTTATTAASS
ncbi:myb-like protein AA isoform X2 [Zeugodacus cucurbitae]|uniref:myb-like protein AA isoform X2 n=1 Tax=Zeugodacus cucurbitae TaxID=28588 RepID=UPI0023D93D5D|nr:myb-like protein AA isoform X2 [Zeugodacus cucurbitae]